MLHIDEFRTDVVLTGHGVMLIEVLSTVFKSLPSWRPAVVDYWDTIFDYPSRSSDPMGKISAWKVLTRIAVPNVGDPDPKRGTVGGKMEGSLIHPCFITPCGAWISTPTPIEGSDLTTCVVVSFPGRLSVKTVAHLVAAADGRLDSMKATLYTPGMTEDHDLIGPGMPGLIETVALWGKAVGLASTRIGSEDPEYMLNEQLKLLVQHAENVVEDYIKSRLQGII